MPQMRGADAQQSAPRKKAHQARYAAEIAEVRG
jgi:hypothetical protein